MRFTAPFSHIIASPVHSTKVRRHIFSIPVCSTDGQTTLHRATLPIRLLLLLLYFSYLITTKLSNQIKN